MSIVTITGIDSPRGSDEKLSYCLDRPREASTSDGYGLTLRGWVLGRRTPVTTVDLMVGARRISRIPVGVSRPDIAAGHPDVPWSEETGFIASIGVLRLPSPFQLQLTAVFRSGETIPLASVQGERRLPSVATADSMQPVMLTTLGRSGSTWVTRLLGRHPDIFAYRPFEFEARMASYWMEILVTLSEPASQHQALRGNLTGPLWWTGLQDETARAVRPIHSELEDWLSRRHAESLAAHCVERIEDFYRRATSEEGDRCSRFIEKCSPATCVQDLLWDFYPGAEELFLVRDFRDVVCSILAYNEKRGVPGFGREQVDDDVGYVSRFAESVKQLLASWRARRERAHLLRYEDLISNPRQALASVFRHLQVEDDDAVVDGVLSEAMAMTPAAQAAHRTAPSAAESVGRWRRDLEPELLEACEKAFADELHEFGYHVGDLEATG